MIEDYFSKQENDNNKNSIGHVLRMTSIMTKILERLFKRQKTKVRPKMMLLGWMMKTYNITIVTRHSGRKELRTTPIGEATVYKKNAYNKKRH